MGFPKQSHGRRHREGVGRSPVEGTPGAPHRSKAGDSLARCVHLGRVEEVDAALVGDGHQLLGHLQGADTGLSAGTARSPGSACAGRFAPRWRRKRHQCHRAILHRIRPSDPSLGSVLGGINLFPEGSPVLANRKAANNLIGLQKLLCGCTGFSAEMRLSLLFSMHRLILNKESK